MTLRERITVEQFEEFVRRPENVDKLFEFIGGEIFEVPSNAFVSEIAGMILFFIRLFLRETGKKGHVTGEAGGYQVGDERYAPDVGYISYERQAELAKDGYNPNPPELAVEVVSSGSKTEMEKLTIKLGNYLAAGTVVWIVRVEGKYIEVHQPGKPVQTFREGETLDGGEVLPGFTLAVSEIFTQ